MSEEEFQSTKSEAILPALLFSTDVNVDTGGIKRNNSEDLLISKRRKPYSQVDCLLMNDDTESEKSSRVDCEESSLVEGDLGKMPAAVFPPQDLPTAHDILLAPRYGADYRQYAGNMKLDIIIRQASLYNNDDATYTFKEKAELVTRIVQKVKQWKPPGRFLKLDEMESKWVEVPDQYAELHVLQVLLRYTSKNASGLQPCMEGASLPREPEHLAGVGNMTTRKLLPNVASSVDVKAPAVATTRAKSPCPLHPEGQKHLHRAALQSTHETLDKDFQKFLNNGAATSTGEPNSQVAAGDHFSTLDAGRAKDFAYFPEVDEFGCLKEDNIRCFDLSDKREEYDEAVIEVALHNYECFHGLKHGAASFGAVSATSAGITGWAASVIHEKKSIPKQDVVCVVDKNQPGKKSRSDPEEDRQLQIALLESLGCCPSRLKVSYEENNFSSNEYDYGSSYSEDEWSDDEDEDAEEGEEKNDFEDQQSKEVSSETKVILAKGTEEGDTEDCHKKSTGSFGPSASHSVDQPASRRTVLRSSWQFQQLISQVRESAASRPTKDSEKPPYDTIHQANAKKSDSSDDESWSQVSSGGCSTGSLVVVNNKAVDDQGNPGDSSDDWECVQEEGTKGADDDWSDVSA